MTTPAENRGDSEAGQIVRFSGQDGCTEFRFDLLPFPSQRGWKGWIFRHSPWRARRDIGRMSAAVRRLAMLHRALEAHAANSTESGGVSTHRIMASAEIFILRHPTLYSRELDDRFLIQVLLLLTLALYTISSLLQFLWAVPPSQFHRRDLRLPDPDR